MVSMISQICHHHASVVLHIITALIMSHIVTVLYAREFVWKDLRPTKLFGRKIISKYYSLQSPETAVKALLCFVLLTKFFKGNVSVSNGQGAVCVLALPQLYRLKGSASRQMRVVLGPLTPLLAFCNMIQQPNVGNGILAATSGLAFVVLRPDNTAVLSLLIRMEENKNDDAANSHSSVEEEGSTATTTTTTTTATPTKLSSFLTSFDSRRKLHGMLAACNTVVALCLWLSHHFHARDMVSLQDQASLT